MEYGGTPKVIGTTCPGRYIISTGTAIECNRQPGHPGQHEGYYPGDNHLSHWRESARGEQVDCDATISLEDRDFRCDRVAGHQGNHDGIARSGIHRHEWEPLEALTGARGTQVGGSHYSDRKIQPWDVIDEYGLSFYAGNALKYLLRAGRKGSRVEDLKKARHYLDKLIELEEE